ncbi:potassium channel family protein [Streptomyces bungoensis]|uniref:potassium channel family protein n=1 Tax=Streptomyces bungoensis TaxID=285568 RepID=UPI0034357242
MIIVIVDCILGLLWTLKTIGVGTAILWLRKNGVKYRREAYKVCGDWKERRMQLIDALEAAGGGKVIPCGVNEFKLKRAIWRARPGHKGATTVALRVIDGFLYRGQYMAMYTLAWLYASTAILPPRNHFDLHLDILTWVAFASLIETIALVVEALLATLILQNYAHFFRLRWSRESQRLEEFKMFGIRVFRVWIGGASVFYIWQLHWSVLSGPALEDVRAGSPGACIKFLLQCFYFVAVAMSTVGFGDIAPRNGLGQLAMFFLVFASFSWITLAFAVVSTIRSNGFGDRTTDETAGTVPGAPE